MACLAWIIWVCTALGAWAQGFAGLGTAAQDYAPVVRGTPIVFPQDHGAHPGFRIEWWYLTANMTDAEGRPMGLQWTLFRQAGAPGGADAGWQSAQIWMGHAAVTTAQSHLFAETFGRGGIGQAGVRTEPFEAWIDDWRMTGSEGADPFDALRVSARGDGFSYDVRLVAEGPLVRHGEAGFSVKSEAGQASYYYSQPAYRLTGTVTLGGTRHDVTGSAWLDREWSSQPLAEDQTGWDWFSLSFGTGEKLMAFHLRSRDGGGFTSGTWIGADGTPEPLKPGAVTMTPLGTAEVAGRDIPVRWRLDLPARGLRIETTPLNPQAYMATVFPYWEGPITFTGTHDGQGYLEMTGY